MMVATAIAQPAHDARARLRAHLDAHPARRFFDGDRRTTLALFSLRELAEAAGASRERVRQILLDLRVTLARRCLRCHSVFAVNRGAVQCPDCRRAGAAEAQARAPKPAPLTRTFRCGVCGQEFTRTGRQASIQKWNAKRKKRSLCSPACVSEMHRQTAARLREERSSSSRSTGEGERTS